MTEPHPMASPLIKFPQKSIVLPPQFFGSIGYYALAAAYGKVYIHNGMRFDKRFKSTHRTTIADTRGTIELTVPVSKPHSSSQAAWSDITVSAHGGWWNVQLTALESAYGRTPFFEFYIDSLKHLFSADMCGRPVTELDREADTAVRALLGLDNEVIYLEGSELPEYAYDARKTELPQASEPYYQVRADKLGFIPGLSILDLLFNLGPEAPLYLKKVIDLL
ncbi:MAG: WbqC family protein [Muribaculaceae bacterium]|nr:WbqC family protein [Muribaculaceae bacterium]